MIIKTINILISILKSLKDALIKIKVSSRLRKINLKRSPTEQQLEVYWKADFAQELDLWGSKDVWIEIKYLLCAKEGKVLDICCGTGGTIKSLECIKDIKVYGFDISNLLIEKAIKSGISSNFLKVQDAAKTDYEDNEFDYSYSIGSLEHFTVEGIDKFLSETKRITKKTTFHQIPVVKDKNYEGWLELDQSYYNMSEEWWLNRFKKYYNKVFVIESFWDDPISNGRWFVCEKN